MDNKVWSQYDAYYSIKMDGHERLTKGRKLEKLNLKKGSQFKYVFNFGEEWRFQCKVLRELEEDMKTPLVIRSVGESPEQYPEYEDEEELLPEEELEKLYEEIPLSRQEINRIHLYMDVAANLYGLIPMDELYALYNSQNPAVEELTFFMAVAALYQNLNNHTHKHANRGNTPDELFAQSPWGLQLRQRQKVEELLRQRKGMIKMTELEIMQRAKMYMEKLAQGIDPISDQEIPEDSVLNNVRLARCFFYVSGVLDQVIANGGKVAHTPQKDFSITDEELRRINPSQEPIRITQFVELVMNAINDADRKRLKTTTITSWLIEKGFMSKQADADGKSKRLPTAMGERIGLSSKLREGQYGTYQAVYYSEEAQRFLLDHLQEILQAEK